MSAALLAACDRPSPVSLASSDPKLFLDHVYARAFSRPPSLDWLANRAKIFDVSTAALLAGPPVLDLNPLCQCDHPGRINTQIAITPTGPATARGDITVEDETRRTLRPVAIDLTLESGEWRIHDITSAFGDTLRGAYQPAADLQPKVR